MKKLLLLMVLFACVSSVYAKQVVIDELPSPQFMSSDGDFYIPEQTSYPKVTQVEQSLFKQTYPKEPIEMRLKRIEMKMFNKSFEAYPLSQRTDNILAYTQELSIDKNALGTVEKAIMSKNYTSDTPSNRVARMEQQVFGAVQSGELSDRIETLRTLASNAPSYSNSYGDGYNNSYGSGFSKSPRGYSDNCIYNRAAQSVINSIPLPKQVGKAKGALGSITSFFMGGNPTGWTPQVQMSDLDSPYPYGTSGYNTYGTSGYNTYGGGYPYNQQPYGQTYGNPYTYRPQGFQTPAYPQQYYQQPQQYQQYQQGVVPQYLDLFSSGNSGSEKYYTDGRYRKDLRNSGGGASVTIIK